MRAPPRPAAEIRRRAAFAVGKDRPQQTGEARGPGERVILGADQILPDLDQRVGQSARRRDRVDRVAGKRAVIGLVVADLAGGKIRLGGQRLDQRLWEPAVAVPQDPDLPRTRRAAHDGGERMDRDDGRRLAGREHRIDRRRDLLPVRRPEARAAAGDLPCIGVGVARHDRAVGKAHDQRRIVQAPIRVDDQARKGRQHGWRAKFGRERAGHVGGADVIGDVPFERLARQSERPVAGRNGVGGVIANDERAGVERAWNRFESGKSVFLRFEIEARWSGPSRGFCFKVAAPVWSPIQCFRFDVGLGLPSQFQIYQNPAKPGRHGAKAIKENRPRILLDLLVGNEPFQRVMLTPQALFSFLPDSSP